MAIVAFAVSEHVVRPVKSVEHAKNTKVVCEPKRKIH